MADLFTIWQNDIPFLMSGDAAVAYSSEQGRQRVMRRLFTNPGDYFAHPDYGAGLPLKVGTTDTGAELQAIVLSQMLLEDVVSQDPAPIVTVGQILNGVTILVQYSDAITGEPVTINFDVNK